MTVVPVAHHANVDARTDVRIAIVGKYVENYVYRVQNVVNGDVDIIDVTKYAANHAKDLVVMNPVEKISTVDTVVLDYVENPVPHFAKHAMKI